MQPQRHTDVSISDATRYQMLVEAVTDYAIYMLDADGYIVSWNAGATRLKGYAEAEIVGEHFSRFYPEADVRAGMPARTLETARREGRFEAEGWRVRKGGERFWAHVVVDPIWDASGRLVGYAKVTRDLSERRAAEESLRRSEQQFTLLVQGVTDYAIYMLDPHGIVTNWNSGAQRIKGYAPDEVIGSHFSRFYIPEDRVRGDPQRALETAAREGRFESDGWRVRKDGTRFWANVVIDPIRDESGAIVGFAKITRDVSEKREAEQTLERAREALMQSQKLEAIGQLTGGVAHDFNNLLMVILSSLELARRRLPDDDRLVRLIDNAVHGARRGVSLTQRMLAFARRQQLLPVATDVAGLVQGMSELLTRSLGPMVQVETDFPDDLGAVLIDANQLELAILNLAVNARDAMPDGGLLRIAARQQDVAGDDAIAPGTYVCLSITDSGRGMDAATLARAMEPFFTTKGPGKGTGLGLPMVHGLAAQSGGRFGLTSEPGHGTTAELWLPVARVGDAAATPGPASRRGDAAAGRQPLLVVAVDDDGLVLTGTVAMLEDLGHTVRAANSAAQALEIVRSEPRVDLVVTDQMMPVMSGAELIQVLHAERPGLPVLLATGYGEVPGGLDPTIRRLAKPFEQADLADAIDAAVGAHAARSPGPGPAPEPPAGAPDDR